MVKITFFNKNKEIFLCKNKVTYIKKVSRYKITLKVKIYVCLWINQKPSKIL